MAPRRNCRDTQLSSQQNCSKSNKISETTLSINTLAEPPKLSQLQIRQACLNLTTNAKFKPIKTGVDVTARSRGANDVDVSVMKDDKIFKWTIKQRRQQKGVIDVTSIDVTVYGHGEAVEDTTCTAVDDDGEEILGAILQSASNEMDAGSLICDVIDPLDVAPVTRLHEHLVSSIIRVSSENIGQVAALNELLLSVPIAHWYVEPWQEVVVRRTDKHGNWREVDLQADIVYYGVHVPLTDTGCVAVLSRPKLTTVTLSTRDQIVHALSDDRVKMKAFASDEEKEINMQVVPVELCTVEDFQARYHDNKTNNVISSSPLLIVNVNDREPESLVFEVPYVTPSTRRSGSPSPSRCSSHHGRPEDVTQDSLSPYVGTGNGKLSPYHSSSGRSPPSPRHLSVAAPMYKDPSQTAFHLVNIDENGEVKIKLIENKEERSATPRRSMSPEVPPPADSSSLKFSVFDRTARLIAVETRGSLLYSDVQHVTRAFVDSVVLHRVSLLMLQDSRNPYTIALSATIPQPHKRTAVRKRQNTSPTKNPLTVDFVRLLCTELVGEWSRFARALGVSNARIQAIKQQHHNAVNEHVILDVIISWMKTRPLAQDKVDPVITALHGGKVPNVTKEIDENHVDDSARCQSALEHWKTHCENASVWKLVDALRASHCGVVADTIVASETRLSKR
ncbi:hypothetical protein MAR_033770 [Mya arenaria]|uniref:Death domain-containing protein n=1 Tax=Mya arenaria TaxID=6604 RepID=A0ABY7G9Z1_MYAAR|nr:hypothetical protein MAR_033770 [Mya arenaria]